MASTPSKRTLPSKESSLFRELLNLYETRQLKKGQKTADQILKKFPEHGETLCMKGLILTHMGKREEGLELVKKGVRLDLTSHIVWHVFGLIQKGEKNYEEALKSYTQALRFDKENMNILRDAAHLQTQLRFYDGLVDTRFLLLKLRPNLRQNWIGLALAYHLNGNLGEAKKVLEQYERSLKNVPDHDPDHSDLLLYHVRVLEDIGELAEALAFLNIKEKSKAIVDQVAIMETRARLLLKQGPGADAEQAWRALIQRNPDNISYYYGYLGSKNIELVAGSVVDADLPKALQQLRDLSVQNPRAVVAPRRLELMIVPAEDFKPLAGAYILRALKKGIPSLFVDLKPLYHDSQKRVIIEELVECYRRTLEEGLLPDEPSDDVIATSEGDVPTTYLWALYFLAQHFSHVGQHTRALSVLSSAITHTPTLPELHTLRGRVLKRLGDLHGASAAVNEARLLDGQDRFLNTKSAKYKLRAGLIEEASDTLGLFTKKDAVSPGADLEEMQSLLYLTEEANAHRRQGKIHHALKKYHAVRKIFEEFEDDQFDFHGYSLRKFTINIYLKSSPFMGGSIYVKLFDNPSLAKDVLSTGLTAEEAKKAKKKAKKAQQRQEEQRKATANATSTNEDKGLDLTSLKDDDPDARMETVNPLLRLSLRDVDSWTSIYDVAVRRGKYVQAIRALNHANAIDADHPELHVRYLHFRKLYEPVLSSSPPLVVAVVSGALDTLLSREMSLETYNAQYLQRHSAKGRAVLAAAKGLQILGSPKDEIEGTLFSILNPEVDLPFKIALDVWSFLKDINSSRADEFRLACDKKFDLSTVFKTPDEVSLTNTQEVDG
ncbi:NMDA receptor-regulated protein 1-domain-containing protein [Lactifluus volemus]|nr:NMDA receptor-regulated protein 1-domain-containing protein [Lactifluus volemus]